MLIKYETDNGQAGYKDINDNVVIQAGKYIHCFTDTMRYYGIVYDQSLGMIAIDQNEKFLFSVYPYDNGPDYPSEGLFRIVENEKIGYANISGKVVIEPEFDCAYPFKNGQAKVSNDCSTEDIGEHMKWTSESWFFIDKKGKVINP